MTPRHFAALDSRGRVLAVGEPGPDDTEAQTVEAAAWLVERVGAARWVYCDELTAPGDWLDPRGLQTAIAASPTATQGVLGYLRERGLRHSGQVSGATLAAVCGVDSRTWRRWVGGEREMPLGMGRLLAMVAGV